MNWLTDNDWTGAWRTLSLDAIAFSAVDIALISCVLISWLALGLALFAVFRLRKQATTTLQLYRQLGNDLHIATNAAMGMGQRIMALEKSMIAVKAKSAGDMVAADNLAALHDKAPANNRRSQTASQVPHKSAAEGVKPSLSVVPGEGVSYSLNVVPATGPAAAPHHPPGGTGGAASPTPFEQAEKLFKSGIAADEVARRCGLSQSEAALMQMVHRRKSLAAR